MRYTIRASPDPYANRYRYLVLRHEVAGGTPSYVSDWPTLEAAKAAVERLQHEAQASTVEHNPWRD